MPIYNYITLIDNTTINDDQTISINTCEYALSTVNKFKDSEYGYRDYNYLVNKLRDPLAKAFNLTRS